MTNPDYVYQHKPVDAIIVRPFAFDFPADIDPRWIPGHYVRSMLFNGLSLTMPYLEPYLVKTMREAGEALSQHAALRADIRAFNGQEASHYKCHRRLNELLKANGYPSLARVEDRMARSYAKLHTRSLQTKLAYNAGFECMTNGFTAWLINQRTQLFAKADRHITSFWLMHMVEETEHKTVAFDTYMAYSGRYWPRFFGVFHGSFHVVGYGLVGMFEAMRADGELWRPRRLWQVVRELASMTWRVGPFMLRALKPGYNPRQEQDEAWMREWVAGHASLEDAQQLPLVDTTNPAMPVPFG